MRQIEFAAGAEAQLDSMLGALRAGNNVDFASPLIQFGLSEFEKEEARDKVAKSIFDRCSLGDLPERLRSHEVLKMWKHWGNVSRRPAFILDATVADSVEKQVQKYFDPLRKRCIIDNDAMLYAIEAVQSLVPLGSLRPLDLGEAAVLFEKSGMGFPVVSSDPAYFEHVFNISKEIWDSGADSRWVEQLPAIAGYRGQPRGRKTPHDPRPQWFAKTRLIYMMPRVTANLEKTIQKPIFDALVDAPQFCAWKGPHAVDVQMTSLLKQGLPVLSLDFKGFDQSVPFEVIDVIFDIIGRWFVGEASELVEYCRRAFKHTGIIVPGPRKGDTRVFYDGADRSGGVPSGSVNTNTIDSLANILVMHYAAYLCKTRVRSFFTQGDDGVYTFTRSVSLADLAEKLSTYLGMTISQDKTYYEEGVVHFLQNVHSFDFVVEDLCVGVRPIMHLASQMTSYERVDLKVWTRQFDTVRWLQQIGQAVHHPRATEMCDWLYDHDWCVREVIERVQRGDVAFVDAAHTAIARKDSALRFWGCAPGMFLSSPVVQYLGERVTAARLLKADRTDKSVST